MNPSFSFPATPGMALFPLSPGRVNVMSQSPSSRDRGRSPTNTPSKVFGHPEFGLPGDFGSMSPLLGEEPIAVSEGAFTIPSDHDFKPPSIHGSPTKHERTSSDVQAMVSRFNTLDIKDHAELRRRDMAALKRAQMGREEAEAEAKRLKSDIQAMGSQLEDGKEREKRVAKRLEDIMDDLHRSKEAQLQTQSLYEKEIRRAKKEAFKSSSTVVKLQEELKTARNVLRSVQSDLDLERIKVERREKDTFNAQYELVGVKEEMERSLARIKALEDEREALKASLRDEQTARIAAEERNVQSTPKPDHGPMLPEIRRLETSANLLDEQAASNVKAMDQLRQDFEIQSKALEDAEDIINFMKMECQLGCCSCRTADSRGEPYVHDGDYDLEMQQIQATVIGMLMPPLSVRSEAQASSLEYIDAVNVADSATREQHDHHLLLSSAYLVTSAEGSINKTLAPASVLDPDYSLDTAIMSDAEMVKIPNQGAGEDGETTFSLNAFQAGVQGDFPATPQVNTVRNLTTTTTVPLVDHSNADYSIFSTPTGLTREQAIEQLRQRRGRARSVAGTPRKMTDDPITPRRDISAPQMTSDPKTPASSWRGRTRQDGKG